MCTSSLVIAGIRRLYKHQVIPVHGRGGFAVAIAYSCGEKKYAGYAVRGIARRAAFPGRVSTLPSTSRRILLCARTPPDWLTHSPCGVTWGSSRPGAGPGGRPALPRRRSGTPRLVHARHKDVAHINDRLPEWFKVCQFASCASVCLFAGASAADQSGWHRWLLGTAGRTGSWQR